MITDRKEKIYINSKPKFLFIGVMREEKGVQILVDAWKKLGNNFNGELVIAGFKPQNVQIDFSKLNDFKNFKLIMKSLSDNEYSNLIKETDYAIFPYLKVGNSGVLSTVVSLNKVPITTKLKVFVDSEFVNEDLICEVNNVDDLAKKIKEVSNNHQSNYINYTKKIEENLNKNKKDFYKNVIEAYKKIEYGG